MQGISYEWTIFLAYAFFVLTALEVWFEPSLRTFRLALLVLMVAATTWFSVAVTFAKAPLVVSAYVPPGGHADETAIGGISWDSHFTELRIAISNSTADDYQNLDVLLKPDKWTHKASLLEDSSGCGLSEIGGNVYRVAKPPIKTGRDHKFTGMRVGAGFETYDNLGNEWVTVASESGYRLRCATIPSKSTIKIVFALIKVRPEFMIPKVSGPPGGFNLDVKALAGVTAWFDLLDSRPNTQRIALSGKYLKGIKPHSIEETITIRYEAAD